MADALFFIGQKVYLGSSYWKVMCNKKPD